MAPLDEATLSRIEREHAEGMGSQEILDLLGRHHVGVTEATLRKYVQMGLLPRSVRVGRKGKHQGSQGRYPVGVVRRILDIKRLLAESWTIEEIQRDLLFVRAELDQLEAALTGVFRKLELVTRQRRAETTIAGVVRDLAQARALGRELVRKLGDIETRLTAGARVKHEATG
ncbi:MAG: hypothetical protein IT376_17505 [Polyangiaceae bacterium]|nr:hypothetical protein [Polyangiaceae bacterium]